MDPMEQRDYLLREIEKIGIIMNSFRQKLFGGKGNFAISPENRTYSFTREANILKIKNALQ